MSNDSIYAGLRKKTSQKGKNYYGVSKPVEINGKQYWINVFKNTNSNTDSPDLDLFIDEAEPQRQQTREQRPQDDDSDIPF